MRRSPGTIGGGDGREWEATVSGWLVAGALAGGLLAWPGALAGQVTGQPPEQRVEERPVTPDVERPQEAGAQHEVRRGDTLWDLARRYLSDPFQWPDIFELNRDVVEDPHWIYPGEDLRLPGSAPRDATRVADRAAGAAQEAPAEQQVPRRPGGMSRFGGTSLFDESPSSGNVLGALGVEEYRPSPLVSASDHYRAPYLAEGDVLGPSAVTARKIEGNPLGLSLPAAIRGHHEVVLALGGLSVEQGERLQAVRPSRSLGAHGRVVRPMAMLEVRAVEGDSARAEVLEVFGDYRVGDAVVGAEPFAFEMNRRRPAAESAMVVDVLGYDVEQVLLGRGDMVFLDVGSSAGVRLGDEFAVFGSDERRPAEADWNDRMAVVRVVRVQPRTATAMVVDVQELGVEPGVPARLVFRAAGE